MGRQLERQAWIIPRKRLANSTARLLLVRMAHTAKDTDEFPAYFGGWDTLALALGYDSPTSKAAEKAVGRSIAQLIEAGYISADGFAPGGNRRYLLHL